MTGRTFIGTNIFVYADDADTPAKQAVAQRLIRQLAAESEGVVSTQVLMEYVAAARRRLGLSLDQCRHAVLVMTQLEVVQITIEHVLGALDLATLYSLSQWDALIVKTAAATGCNRLLTEDMRSGQTINGVLIDNPFV
jgi:predicted nucleic acid-binding protein